MSDKNKPIEAPRQPRQPAKQPPKVATGGRGKQREKTNK